MSTLKLTAAALIAAGLLTACAQDENPEGVIPEGYKSALDKAEGVEDKLQDSLQMRGQEVEESER